MLLLKRRLGLEHVFNIFAVLSNLLRFLLHFFYLLLHCFVFELDGELIIWILPHDRCVLQLVHPLLLLQQLFFSILCNLLFGFLLLFVVSLLVVCQILSIDRLLHTSDLL